MAPDTTSGFSEMSFQELYGGNLTVQLPPNAKDVRQIPDNQEVFAHSVTDQSLIFEIMEYAGGDDMAAIRTHFSDLAAANDVSDEESAIVLTEAISGENLTMKQCSSAYYVLGKQNVAKFNESAKNTIDVHMGLFRLPDFSADILVTFNNPVSISMQSTSHQPVPVNSDFWMVEDFKQVLTSLKIINEGIFGE